MSKKMLALYSLKYNPFCQEVPVSALFVSPAVEHFCWRIENQLGEGGFALVTGAPGSGKSAALRIMADRLGNLCDVNVGVLTRPHASVADFYRELGDLFGVTLTPSNRWWGAHALRQKWIAHIEASLYRPVLLIDEAQAMRPSALCELQLLASAELDSRSILTVVLAGDERLAQKLQTDERLPMASRIRCRLRCTPAEANALKECLTHHLQKAGNPRLIAKPVIHALCEHAAGNYRVLMNMANDLLAAALQREADQIDEKLFFEVFDIRATASQSAPS
ncbi:MAG: general secretion pathway protein GspA [Lysobacterales bacterium]|nr:MAG: general secretion pathway protein GspA [Xanthomonadales bacterium]